MEYILISIILLIAFGGIFYILPSKHDRIVSKLRLEARRLGISTSIASIPDVNAPIASRVTAGGVKREPKVNCVIWELPYEEDYDDLPIWRLIKSPAGSSPVPGTVAEPNLKDPDLSAHDDYWSDIRRAFSHMPKLCLGIESSKTGVRWLGREDPGPSDDGSFVQEITRALKLIASTNIKYSREQLARKDARSPSGGTDK